MKKFIFILLAIACANIAQAQIESLQEVSIDTSYSISTDSYVKLEKGKIGIITSKHYDKYHKCYVFSAEFVDSKDDGYWEEAHIYLTKRDGRIVMDVVYDAVIDNYYNVKLEG